MNIYQRLNAAREAFHALELKKSGENKFAGYKYFELGDFLIPGLQVFKEHGLCAIVTFTADTANMHIRNVDKMDEYINFTSPMGSANLKGCHEVQNIGAVETYQRRYLWVAALEIVEHDALEPSTGSDQVGKKDERASLQMLEDLRGAALGGKVMLEETWKLWKKRANEGKTITAETFDRVWTDNKKSLLDAAKKADAPKEPIKAE